MRIAILILMSLFGSTVLLTRFDGPAAGQLQASRSRLALIGGTIYLSPTDEPLNGGVVLIQEGKIAAVGGKQSVQIPHNTETIDCSGLTITAGFWNSHAHFFERKWTDVATLPAPEVARQLEEMLTRYGFTNVFEPGGMWTNTRQLRDRIESGEVPGPRIRSTGEALIAGGAVPPDTVIRALGYMPVRNYEIADAAQATAAAKKLLDAGTDGIKVHLQRPPPPNPPLPESAIQAAVNEAHKAGKPVFIHPTNGADVLAALRAGVDVIAHTTPTSGPWDETILSAVKDRRVALTPTLMLWKEVLRRDRISLQERSVSTSTGQLRAWIASGGTVLFGTDLGAVGYDPSEEYALMAKAGLSFRQILASVTTAPAQHFGMSTALGRIASGFVADLTVLRDDPAKDIRAFARVQYTVRDGRIIYRAPQ
jgi:imidazolonepropionase-like amidohydrolase